MSLAEPRWVPRLVIEAIHVDQVREHGGLIGLRGENALESALARPEQKWHYEPESDLAELTAAYAFGLSSNHPFTDGNGRSGRALWLWQMNNHAPFGFLHTFYYQTLENSR